MREADRQIAVLAEELERAAALGLRKELCPQVRGSDRVRLGDDRRTAVLVAADCEREPEGEDQADDAEQGRLQHAERLAQCLRVLSEVPAEQDAHRP